MADLGAPKKVLEAELKRLGITPTSKIPDDIIAWKVCDNGANMVAAWAPVGIAFSQKRKRAQAETLKDIMFARENI